MKSRHGLLALLSCLLLVSLACNGLAEVGSGGSAPGGSGPTPLSPQAAPTPPDIPAPPSIPPVGATESAGLATELAQRLSDAANEAERLAIWLAVYQTAGIPVIAEDGTPVTDTGDDPLGPPYWQVWYASGMDRPKHGMTLADAGKILTMTPEGSYAADGGQALLEDLRAATQSSDPYERFLGLFLRERVSRGASGADLLDPEVTPETAIIDPASVQFLSWALVRSEAYDIAVAEGPTSGLQLASYSGSAVRPRVLSAAPRCAGIFGSEDTTTVVNWIFDKVYNGAEIPQGGSVKGLVERGLEGLGLSGDRIAKVKGVLSGANAIGTILSFYMQVQALEIEVIDSPGGLERSKTTKDGEEITLQFRLFYDKKKADGDKLWACMANFIASKFGVTFSLPSSQPIAGAEVTFSPGKNIPEKVLINSSNPGHRFTTDANGVVALPLIGRGQKENLPDSVPPYDDAFTVHVSAQPEAVSGSSLGNMFWDSFTFWSSPGIPGAVAPLVDMLKTLSYNLGEFEFGLTDWGNPAYRASGGEKFEMSGTFCLAQPSTLLGGSGSTFEFAPSGPNGGTVTYTREEEGCTESGVGPYSVSLNADGSMGTVTWSADGSLSCPGLGTFSASGGESFDIASDTNASCQE